MHYDNTIFFIMRLTDRHIISYNEAAVLKGLAILAIMLHNFCHKLPGAVLENQHFYSAERFNDLIRLVSDAGPHFFINLLSHYGHYGVAVFVFISGYGLAAKYTDTRQPVSLAGFAAKHAKKLWLLMLPLLVPHFVFMCIKSFAYFDKHALDFVLITTFTSGFKPFAYVFHGPWWFFSLIFQLYIVFYLTAYRRSLKPIMTTTAVCMALQVAATAFGNADTVSYMSRTFVGHMLPFTAGILFARKKLFPTYALSSVLLVLFFVCGANEYTWLLTFALIAVPLTSLAKALPHCGKIHWALLHTGFLSAFIFVIHPIIRSMTFGMSKHHLYLSIVLYAALSIAAAALYRLLLTQAVKMVFRKKASRA